jgi:hypothetical protein
MAARRRLAGVVQPWLRGSPGNTPNNQLSWEGGCHVLYVEGGPSQR